MKRLGALALGAVLATGTRAQEAEVVLEAAGPPIAASETGHASIYNEPHLSEEHAGNQGVIGAVSQGWSMLGREDRGASIGSNEYEARPCERRGQFPIGVDAVLEDIAQRAAQTRIVIINESHEVTYHREFSRRVVERLRSLGYSVFAAETFINYSVKPDPVSENANLSYPAAADGWYSKEPIFGALMRTAKRLGYRLATYEIARDAGLARPRDFNEGIAQREHAQAMNLADLLATLNPDEKLIVHAGYWHASERVQKHGYDQLNTSMMAARLPEMTGIDPLTIAQTECRGSGPETRISIAPKRIEDRFDIIVDHPKYAFRQGRPTWRFANDAKAVEVPESLRPTDAPLVIEAFAKGEPFDAVPIDRVWAEPGEDVRLALPPGSYAVRAVIPVLVDREPTTP